VKINQSRFNSLDAIPDIKHTFILRHPKLPVNLYSKDKALELLTPYHEEGIKTLGYSANDVAVAGQVHSDQVYIVDAAKGFESPISSVDGLITFQKNILLGIYVADCCAVYIADKHSRAVALVHSGKKGSQLGIVKKVLLLMNANGVDSGDLVVQLSPCIRPPAYEVDFASWIQKDCLECGVPANSIHDNLECTSQNLEAYYSYRSEMGMTGRMLALIGIEGD
jgi:hypothetical protein